jgi:subtilisin family serine protease
MRVKRAASSLWKREFLVLVLFIGLCLVGVRAWPQVNPMRDGEIGQIDIDGLVPFQISFQFRNIGQTRLENVHGKAVLNDRAGNPIEEIPIDPFSVGVEKQITVAAASRWEFQTPGIYILQITLDIGLEGLVSKSLAFRIVPITLPLAPAREFEGEGLYTVSQQPANWGVSRIDAPLAWRSTHGVAEVVVAVIDSGIDFAVPQLASCMWTNDAEIPNNGIDDDRNGYIDDIHGWDFRDDDHSSAVGTRLHWHGTFVASIIAAWPGDNAIVGIAPGVKIMDVRFLDYKNLFYKRDWNRLAQAIDYAVDNGARIINLSIYTTVTPPAVLEQAIRRALQQGVIIVAITGNNGRNTISYPGRYDGVIAVSATDRNDRLAEFSNYGDEVEVTAPGTHITSLINGGIPTTKSGTSFAAPHVTALLALILSTNPSLSAAEAVAIMEDNAIDLGAQGCDNRFGYGLINAYSAVNVANEQIANR